VKILVVGSGHSQIHEVAVHVRWFDVPSSAGAGNALEMYYRRAIAFVEERIETPYYFLFSDFPAAAREKLDLPVDRVTCVSHNKGDEGAYADLWLMSRCKHFITANSTFSWWGAWLGGSGPRTVVTPDLHTSGKAAWGFPGLIPLGWVRI